MASLLDAQQPRGEMERGMSMITNSTLATALPNLVGGYIMGFGFSLFGSMISAETATQSMGTADFFRHSVRTASRLGRSFAFFGFLFGGVEVALEKRRGRKDVWNPTISGGLLAGAYGWRMHKAPGLVIFSIAGAAGSLALERMMNAMGFGQH